MFRLPDAQARAVLGEVVQATQQRRQIAARNGLTERERAQMASAFEHSEATAALDLTAASA